MAFSSIAASSPLSSTADFAANDVFMGFELEFIDLNEAIENAREQLHCTMKAKEEEDIRWWMEQWWEEQMWEWDLIVGFVDRDSVREAGEHAVVEIGKRWLKVSAGFLFVWSWLELTWF